MKLRVFTGILCFLTVVCIQGSGCVKEKQGGTQNIKFPDERLTVNGLPWFGEDQPVIHRLPKRLKKNFRNVVWELARHSSGGRIRFCTNSQKLTLRAKVENGDSSACFSRIGQSGFDLYVDGLFKGTTTDIGNGGKIDQSWELSDGQKMREITLYMPLYRGVSIRELVLDSGARITAPRPFKVPNPVVYYGTSITQGACSSNAGMSYPAILSRRLNLDFVNLGITGQGHGYPSMAMAITEIKASAYVIDYWANVSAEKLEKSLPPFVDILRKAAPLVPILVVGPFYTSGYDSRGEKEVSETFVRKRRKEGDENIYFVDGFTMISEKTAYALVDGQHPNTLGFQLIADALEGPLKRAMKLK